MGIFEIFCENKEKNEWIYSIIWKSRITNLLNFSQALMTFNNITFDTKWRKEEILEEWNLNGHTVYTKVYCI